MDKDLLEAFLKEEANDHVRKLLLRKISECQTGAAIGRHKFEFNRFVVTIDRDSKQAIVEDDLTAGVEGEGRLPIAEFGSALCI
jgi:hypothetical protein